MANASDFLIGGNDEHGLNPPTPGKRTPVVPGLNREIYENEFNRAAKEFFLLACLRVGFRIYDVKPEEQDVSIPMRVARVNRAGLSALVTFAYNAYGDGTFNSINGYQVFYAPRGRMPQASRLLSYDVSEGLLKEVENRNRGVGTLSGVGMLESVNCPSTLIEAGFMTNLEDVTRMLDPDYRRDVGEGACQGVCQFLDVPYVSQADITGLPTLRRGARGNAVLYLQYLLRVNGDDTSPDGVFGANTERDVRKFQQDNGLAVDGIVGQNTWNALLTDRAPMIRTGNRGRWVRYAQQKLLSRFYNVGETDGIFGNATDREVRRFQADNGLETDGMIGPNTWRVLR